MIWNEPHLCLKAKLKKENLHLAFNILVSRSRANEICLFDEIWIVVFKYLSYLCQYCRPVPRCKIFDNSEHRTVSYYSLIKLNYDVSNM